MTPFGSENFTDPQHEPRDGLSDSVREKRSEFCRSQVGESHKQRQSREKQKKPPSRGGKVQPLERRFSTTPPSLIFPWILLCNNCFCLVWGLVFFFFSSGQRVLKRREILESLNKLHWGRGGGRKEKQIEHKKTSPFLLLVKYQDENLYPDEALSSALSTPPPPLSYLNRNANTDSGQRQSWVGGTQLSMLLPRSFR